MNNTIFKPDQASCSFQTVFVFALSIVYITFKGTKDLEDFDKTSTLKDYYLKSTMAGNHKEWIEHSEDHPNIDHLNVTCPWDRLRDSHETNFGKINS